MRKLKMYRIPLLLLLLFVPVIVPGQTAYESLLRARAFNDSGKPDLAIELITKTLAANQSDSRLYVERAEARLAKGDYSGAILDFNIANKHVDNSGEFGLARIYALKRDASTAVYHLERNLSSPFRKPEKEIMLDPAFGLIENTPEWKLLWKKEWYTVAEKSVAEIEYAVSKGDPESAKSVLAELRTGYRDLDAIVYLDALISFSSGKYADAIKLLSSAADEEQNDEKRLRLLAKAHEANENFAGASAIYTRLLDMEVPDAGLLTSRAACYLKTGEAEKAKADLDRFLSIDAEDKNALSMAGRLEAASGDNIKALSYFSKNLELHPGDAQCYIDRANSYFRSKSWKWAIGDYSMALDLNPGNAEAWLSKGLALLNSGKPEDACHDFQRSFSLGNKRAAEYISRNCIK